MFLRVCLLGVVVIVSSVWARGESPSWAPLVTANDALIERALAVSTETAAGSGARSEAVRLLVLSCGYVAPSSRYHRAPMVAEHMRRITRALRAVQPASGLFDSGNLESPPDTGFILEALARAQLLLRRDDGGEATAGLRDELGEVIRRSAHGIAAGGVHTPNHRWGVAATLALVHHLDPDPRYIARIDEWLAEGIDQDADGQYSERSPAYSAYVVNPALLTLAELRGRTDFIERVRRNVLHAWWLTDATGEMVTVASRRQDQRAGAKVSISAYYRPARWLAVHTGDLAMAALARHIEAHFLGEVADGAWDPNWPLPELLKDPGFAGPLPEGGELPETFSVELPGSGLVRQRRGAATATIYGGSDHGTGLGVGSGLAMNPTFFLLRHGAAQVGLRLTPAFFGTGFFYSDSVTRSGDGWRLHQTLAVPYHHPLPAEHRRADGDYALTPDGRFFSKMDFPHRPKDLRTLATTITVRESDGAYTLAVAVDGPAGVPVTLELAFTGNGELTGVAPLAELAPPRPPSWLGRSFGGGATDYTGMFALKSGHGRFVVGDDAIEFGPGNYAQFPGRMEGEDYTWVGGSLRAEGQRVYLTGVTPFRHELVLRAGPASPAAAGR